MPAFFHNRIIKIIGVILGVFFALVLLSAILLGSLNDARQSSSSVGYTPSASQVTNSNFLGQKSFPEMDGADAVVSESSYPQPTQSDYTAELETYETTTYQVTARTKQFDELCNLIANLKADPSIHFKSLTSSLNNCRATFFVDEAKADQVVASLSAFKAAELNRNTSSVTRHRQQIQSRTNILRQQLARTEKTLVSAEAQLDRLNSQFHNTDEVSMLSSEVTRSMQFIDQLTNKKINLLSQLDYQYQQAADLEARLEVVEFSVNINRSNLIQLDKYSQQWGQAWDNLKDYFVDTLIGLTTVFGIFLLFIIRFTVYALVLIVIARGLWKFVQLLLHRW